MKISHRALSISPFYAMEFAKRAAALEQAGQKVLRLNIGEPDFGAPAPVVERLQYALRSHPMPYTGALGLPALREGIADFYQSQHGVQIPPERVVVTAGASAALLLLTAALVDAGDEVLVGDPSYPCNRQFLASFGADVRLVPTDAASGFQLTADLVAQTWTDRTRGIMLATPSNPTGTSMHVQELQEICRHAKSHDAWRLVDEIYLNLADHNPDGRPAETALAVDQDALVVNSFSKYFGMTGWRLGWCVVPSDLVPVMERLAQNYYICPSTLAQQAAVACFQQDSLAICEQQRVELISRRQVVLDGLAKAGLPVPVPPSGAFYVYFDVAHTGLTSWEFCERALEEAHVALTPGKDFGACGADRYVRASYAAGVETLEEAMERIASLTHRLAS